jgi:acetolactate synthase I/II/III large subunit
MLRRGNLPARCGSNSSSVKYIALEEAFSIPGLAEPMPGLSSRATPYAEQWLRKLPDFTEYRLPDMDATGIDIQVLSLTVPGLQADLDAATARDNARRANDYLVEVVSQHPTRFRGFAALPLGSALPEDAVLVQEAVTNRPAVGRHVSRQPGRLFDTGAPALGWALGGAFGIKLARPDAPVVAVCGDGSFNFGVPTAALWSAHRYTAPFVTIVLNNHSYWASKMPVMALYPDGVSVQDNDFPETQLTPETDYAALAKACGAAGQIVHTPQEMGDAIRWALDEAKEGHCAVLDVRLPQP